jgi:hypothetical protein
MFPAEPPRINPDGPVQASLGAASAWHDRQNGEFANGINSRVTEGLLGWKVTKPPEILRFVANFLIFVTGRRVDRRLRFRASAP